MPDTPTPHLTQEQRLKVALAVVTELSRVGRPDRSLLMTEVRLHHELTALRREQEANGG